MGLQLEGDEKRSQLERSCSQQLPRPWDYHTGILGMAEALRPLLTGLFRPGAVVRASQS